jgi:uncharacterized protein (DUF924 family)
MQPDSVLEFWFEEIEPEQWWSVNPQFDATIRDRFLPLWHRAIAGELYPWRGTATGRVAEVIVLDQFSRNVFRETPTAFAQDPIALVLAQEAVASGVLEGLLPDQRTFLLLPYMHSESRLIHVEAERLFREWTPSENYEFELRHKAIVDRFGRYPHRNATLGRTSTAEEVEFLKTPGSSF